MAGEPTPAVSLGRAIIISESDLRANPLSIATEIRLITDAIFDRLAAEQAGVNGEPPPKAHLPGVLEIAEAAAVNGAHTPLWPTWRTTITVIEPAGEGDRFALRIESNVDCLRPEARADVCDVLARQLAEAQRTQQMLADVDAADEDD